jgi:hypothetical protein
MEKQSPYQVPCFRCRKQGVDVLVPVNGRCPRCHRMNKGSLGIDSFYAICSDEGDHWRVWFASTSLTKTKEVRDRYFPACPVNKYRIPKKIPKTPSARSEAFNTVDLSDAELQTKA